MMQSTQPNCLKAARQVALATSVWVFLGLLSYAQPNNTLRYVIANKTPVYCGPGEDFYVTSHLKSGFAVEVFHRTKDGWCGVRPPDGSYCWLAAENAYLLPGGGSAEVVGQKVPAWIGSTLGTPNQFKWQIELQPTQQVRVLGEAKQRIDAETERLWYRIAPPQGEFRWIRAEALSERAPVADPNEAPIEVDGPRQDSVRNPVVAANESRESEAGVQLASANIPIDEAASSNAIGTSNAVGTEETKTAPTNGSFAAPKKPLPTPKGPTPKGQTPKGQTPKVTGKSPNNLQGKVPASLKSILVPSRGANADSNPVQQAQHSVPTSTSPTIVEMHEEPFQLGEGEVLVSSDDGATVGSTPTMSQEVMLGEGEVLIEDSHPHRRRFPFYIEKSGDVVEEWQPQEPHPRVLVRPLNGILGLVGLGIAESEVLPHGHNASSVITHATPGVDPAVASRLDSLPRPTRRFHPRPGLSPPGEILENETYSGASNRSYNGANGTNPGTRSLLAEENSRENYDPKSLQRPIGSGVGAGSMNGAMQDSSSSRRQDSWHPRPRTMEGPNQMGTNQMGSSPLGPPSFQPTSTNNAMAMGGSMTDDLEPMDLTTPQLREVLVELTHMVALPTDQWDFRRVHQYASDWVERGPSAIERGEARLLVERIQKFESLRLKMNGNVLAGVPRGQPMSYPSTADYRSTNAMNDAGGATYSDEMSLSSASQADASGILSQVFTSRPGQPEFALTDASKEVIAYVIPAPGMNLRRYVNQPVAIYGTRGYLPELASKQIVVDRIVRVR